MTAEGLVDRPVNDLNLGPSNLRLLARARSSDAVQSPLARDPALPTGAVELRRSFADFNSALSPNSRINSGRKLGPMAQQELNTLASRSPNSALVSPDRRATPVVDSKMESLRRKAGSSTVPTNSAVPGSYRVRAEAGHLEKVQHAEGQPDYTAESLSCSASLQSAHSEVEHPRNKNVLWNLTRKKSIKVTWKLSFRSYFTDQTSSSKMRLVISSLKLTFKPKKNELDLEVYTSDYRLEKNVKIRFEKLLDDSTEITFEVRTEPSDAAAMAFGRFFDLCKHEFAKMGNRAVKH